MGTTGIHTSTSGCMQFNCLCLSLSPSLILRWVIMLKWWPPLRGNLAWLIQYLFLIWKDLKQPWVTSLLSWLFIFIQVQAGAQEVSIFGAASETFSKYVCVCVYELNNWCLAMHLQKKHQLYHWWEFRKISPCYWSSPDKGHTSEGVREAKRERGFHLCIIL